MAKAKEKERIHFIGICGKALGVIAAALARAGWAVTGSDEKPYPPMSDYLRECGIAVSPPTGSPETLGKIDIVVVGKRVTATNPDLRHVIENQIPCRSFPQFLEESFLQKSRNIVVAGA